MGAALPFPPVSRRRLCLLGLFHTGCVCVTVLGDGGQKEHGGREGPSWRSPLVSPWVGSLSQPVGEARQHSGTVEGSPVARVKLLLSIFRTFGLGSLPDVLESGNTRSLAFGAVDGPFFCFLVRGSYFFWRFDCLL